MSDSNATRDNTPSLTARLVDGVSDWLSRDVTPLGVPRTDFERLCEHVRAGDVILVEGRSRVAGIIQSVTLSAWTHAALYIGRAGDVAHPGARKAIDRAGWPDATPLVLEAQLGEGVHLSSLARYRREHLRLCRPHDIAPTDRDRVLAYTLDRIGMAYDTRQIFDLLRFFFPYGLLPRHWRSTLFEAGHGEAARAICSTLLANAFASVRYPILPVMHRGADGQATFYRSNARLITPRDFDHSPYFDVIKYPFFGDDIARYRDMIWGETRPKAAERGAK